MASPAFPEPPPTLPATSLADAQARLERLVAHKDAWVKVPISRRVELLRRCIHGVLAVADEWVASAARAKGIAPDDPLAGEEWLGGPLVTVRNLRLLADTLEQGASVPPVSTRSTPDGQQIVKVFPRGLLENLLYTGFVGEIWLEPGKPASQGHIYREKERGSYPPGKVSLVLSAGNVASIGPTDALHKLFVEDEVVIVKMNPVNEYVGPFLERAFACLRDEGVMEVVYGGAEIGGFLAHHALVDSVHITGSDRTHDAIVWGGNPDEQARRKAAADPILKKPITSELGCVTPVIVVPGDWSESDLRYQARHVAGMVVNNGSFNCNAAKVLVLASGWAKKERFLALVRDELAATPPRKAYYPGADSRYQAFLKHYPRHEVLGERKPDTVPWTLIPEVAPNDGEYALSNEAFCGVLAVCELGASEPGAFLEAATRFANERVWGSLSCMVLIDGKTEKQHASAFEKAMAELRYGGIGVNVWAGVIFGSCALTWGAHPGHPLTDIRSGRGTVHNTLLFDHPQKSVLKAPFRIAPMPVWFARHRTLAETGRALTWLEASGSFLRVPRVLFGALRG